MSAPPRAGGLVVYRKTHAGDAIDEHSRRLTQAVVLGGHPAHYIADGLRQARQAPGNPAWVLLQYMPFSYGRWGFAPGLLRDAVAIKRSTKALLGVMVHEAWVAMDNWRTCLMGAYQRAQLRSLVLLADVVFVSMERYSRELRRSAVHLPVGSNISPIALTRADARTQLGLTDQFVVTLFGTANPYRALEHAESALAALVSARGAGALRVFNLGAGTKSLRVPPSLRVDTPGALPHDELSLRLRATDLLLMPFSDGVSTRRTTLMAGLAHGLPVVGLHGASTDQILLRNSDALVLTPVGDHRAYSSAVVDIVGSPARLRDIGEAGLALYGANFDWPISGTRLSAAFENAAVVGK